MNKVLETIIFSFFCINIFSATLENQKSRRISKNYKTIFNKNGYSTQVFGASLSKKFQYQIKKNKQKVIFIWSGEALNDPKNHQKIILVNRDKENTVKANHFFENYTQGKMFLAISELTLTKGTYEVKLVGETKKNPKFYGHSMIMLNKNKNKKTKIIAGLEAFYPGSVHGIDLKEKSIPKYLTVIGGHGLKGNGSTNLINGKPLSLGDDWNGSSGERWDIDQYSINAQKLRNMKQKKVIFEVDPLLQWVFPLVILGTW